MTPPSTALAARIAAQPAANGAANIRLDELLADSSGLARFVEAHSGLGPLLGRILNGSTFLARFIAQYPDATLELLSQAPETGVSGLLDGVDRDIAGCDDFGVASAILRTARTRAATLISLADLGGVWPVDDVIGQLSEVAGRLVAAAVRFLLTQGAAAEKISPANPSKPDEGSGYIVLAMGKMGAGELNFSSDIDLIVLFDAAKAPMAGDNDPRSFFVRLTKDLVRLLQAHTGDGYVYRTDLRLRPDPGATNVAISTDAAAQYYESFGQNWERAAMIKARPVAGDIEAGKAFLDELKPFIWRKYLDFATISDVHSIKRQIQAYRGLGQVALAGHNIKLGRGGIREIEFFVQTQQLIAGGRNQELRGRKTLEMLDVLTREGWIDESARSELAAAYRYLRWLENRIQMVADQQTQTLPKAAEGLAAFARFAGYRSTSALANELLPHLAAVEGHYTNLFEHAPDLGYSGGNLVFTGGDDDPATLETLNAMGFTDASLVSRTVRTWHHGRYAATRTPATRRRLTELLPSLLQALAESEQPDRAFVAFDRFLEGLPAGVQLFAMLHANEHLLALLADLLGTAPRLARQLSARPRTLEAVLDPDFYGPLPDSQAYLAISKLALRADDFEGCLDRARAFGQEQFFRIGVRLLSGTSEAGDTGRANSNLAAGIIASLLDAVGLDVARRAGYMPGGEVVVLGMGKLGGAEMAATSDLDLILIYDVEEGATQSDGERPLSIGQYYSRFAQRFISAVSAPTAEGRLYDVDMRLRPSGRAGPVATRFSAFVDYHKASSWTWEHMALTRARVIAGPKRLCVAVEAAITVQLTVPRDRAAVAGEVVEMRQRIEAEKGTDDIWDIKQVRGGLLDIEFIAQFLQLVHANAHPGVLAQNTEVALEHIATEGLLGPSDAENLLAALRLYQAVTQVIRLCLGELADPVNAAPNLQRRLAQAANLPDIAALSADLAEHQRRVKEIFEAVIV